MMFIYVNPHILATGQSSNHGSFPPLSQRLSEQFAETSGRGGSLLRAGLASKTIRNVLSYHPALPSRKPRKPWLICFKILGDPEFA